MSSSLPQQVVAAIQSVIGTEFRALHEPSFTGNEWVYLKECLDSTFVSSVGKFVDRFEADLAAFTGVEHAVAVVNGTAALHVALLLAGVLPGEEVLMPALTFVATANAVSYCGAVPHFVDSCESNLGICPQALRRYLQQLVDVEQGHCINRLTGRVIRAVVPMHVFGHPVDMPALKSVADEFNLVIVEDAAESLGSLLNDEHTGGFGLLGTLSFNGNKTITTGGGGAILTRCPELARKAKHLTTTAKLPHRWEFEHDQIGFNYRLPNLNAALGCAQLEVLPQFLQAKRQLHEKYAAAFSGCAGFSLLTEPEFAHSNYWLQALVLDEAVAAERDRILAATNDAGVMTRPLWKLMPHLAPFALCPSAPLPVAESLVRRVINIPSSAFL